MRRTNTRKRNRLNFQKLNTKALKVISILIILLIIFIFIYFYFFKNMFIKSNFEKTITTISDLNAETVFSLNKIVIFSSATAESKDLNNSVWNLNISQYSDICIYLNNIPNSDVSKNIINQLYINNIRITTPEYGTPCLYKKSLKDFGKCSFSEDNILSDEINFNVISQDKDINYDNNEIYNDLSVPLSIGFYNKDVKSNFLNSDSIIEYNGKILKRASIPKASISCNVSFDINIINELNEHYICNVSFSIPLEDANSSIYDDGYITMELRNLNNYKFLRIK